MFFFSCGFCSQDPEIHFRSFDLGDVYHLAFRSVDEKNETKRYSEDPSSTCFIGHHRWIWIWTVRSDELIKSGDSIDERCVF